MSDVGSKCRHSQKLLALPVEYKVEARRPVRRPRRTWLESVEADMAKLEIDRQDVHDRKKMRNNVIKRKSYPIGKRTLNR